MEELPLERMDGDTPVWYDGLDNWTKASEAPLTAHLFPSATVTEEVGGFQETVTVDEPQEQEPSQEAEPTQHLYDAALRRTDIQSEPISEAGNCAAGHAEAPCPKTFFGWSIILTLLFCNPIGIIPICTGFSVRTKWRNRDYAGARKMSTITEWWIMITIVTCLMTWPLAMILQS